MSAFLFTRARGLWRSASLLCASHSSPLAWSSTISGTAMPPKSKKLDLGKRANPVADQSVDGEQNVPDAKRKKTEPQEAEPVKKQGKQTKLTAAAKGSSEQPASASKGAVEGGGKAQTDLSKVDFKLESTTTKDGKPWNLKVCSWNVNGVRAWLKSNPMRYLEEESPDVICFQEVKCSEKDLPLDELELPGYVSYWSAAVDKKGYSGTGLLTKKKPIKVTFGMGIKEHDQEGRLIVAEYDTFYVVGCYVPNAGEKLKRLDYRMEWDKAFREYLKKLDEQKPIIYCGDLNVAHNPIDLKNPKSNKNTAGFTQQERDSFSELLKQGFVDSFRHLYPEQEGAYTYWSYRFNARAKNTGWRLDYFVLSERLLPNLCGNVIRKEVYGSDHCPLVLLMAMD